MNHPRDESTYRMPFRTALGALEAAAKQSSAPEAPQAWLEQAEPICQHIEGRWEPYRRRLRSTFREIEKNDLALAPRVGELREGRRTLEKSWLRLSSRLRELPETAQGPEAPARSAEALRLRKDLRDWARSALQLDSAAVTWLLESVHRERGGSG